MLLTNIFSPLSMHCRGGGEVSVFSFSFMDDPPRSGPKHIMVLTGCIYCAWFACCFIVLCYVILSQVILLSAILQALKFSQTFPFPLWEGQLWFTDASAALPMDHGLRGLGQFPWVAFTKMSSNHPHAYLLWGYGGVVYILSGQHDESASLHHIYGTGVSPVVSIVGFDYYMCIHSPHLLDCYCSSCNKDRRIFSVPLPLYILGQASRPHIAYHHC